MKPEHKIAFVENLIRFTTIIAPLVELGDSNEKQLFDELSKIHSRIIDALNSGTTYSEISETKIRELESELELLKIHANELELENVNVKNQLKLNL